MDGNYSLVHKASAGLSIAKPRLHDAQIFITREQVTEFFIPDDETDAEIEVTLLSL